MSLSVSKTTNILPEPGNYSEQISLNNVTQLALQRLQLEYGKPDIIVRCQALPQIEADKHNIEKAFDDMIRMIIRHPPMGTRLYLYINCEEEHKEEGGAALIKMNKRYRISFHTNVCTDEAWKAANEKTIEGCRELLAQYGAGFTVNEIKSTGCLFSISLLGKM